MAARTIQSDFEAMPEATAENTQFPFSWRGGVISALTPVDIKIVAEKKHKRICTLCGQKKPLAYERFSGGLKSYICVECAVRYVQAASKIIKRYGESKA